MDRRKSTITYLPINETLRSQSIPMPAEVIAAYIEQSPTMSS